MKNELLKLFFFLASMVVFFAALAVSDISSIEEYQENLALHEDRQGIYVQPSVKQQLFGPVWFGYTQSFIMLYNEDSAPVQEAAFKPELWLEMPEKLFYNYVDYAKIGYLHHSNGNVAQYNRSVEIVKGELQHAHGPLYLRHTFLIHFKDARQNRWIYEDEGFYTPKVGILTKYIDLSYSAGINHKGQNPWQKATLSIPLSTVSPYIMLHRGRMYSFLNGNQDQDRFLFGVKL